MTFNSTTFLKLFYCSLSLLFFSLMISCGNSKSGLNESKTKRQKPNIIFILLDDLGKEWISKYDADDIETPNIDHLANEGMHGFCSNSPLLSPISICGNGSNKSLEVKFAPIATSPMPFLWTEKHLSKI